MEQETIWNHYQQNIFQDVKTGTGSTIVEALAGVGKTRTAIECLSHIPENKKWLMIAFNKHIAEELKLKAPKTGECSTLHSVGLRSLYKNLGKVAIDNEKIFALISSFLGTRKDQFQLRADIAKATNFAKLYLLDNVKDIDDMLDNRNFDVEIDRKKFIDYILKTLDLSKSQCSTVDFTDMIWLPNVLDLIVPKFDYVFLDEAQDVSLANIKLAIKCLAPGGRFFAFGDPNQAINLFCGAEQSAMMVLKEKLQAKILPLNISYRCPKEVGLKARKFVSHFETPASAIQGEIVNINQEQLIQMAKPGCVILSRVNAPLVSLALKFLKNKIPAHIMGKELGSGLLSLIKSSRCKSIDSLLLWLDKWKIKEQKRLLERHKDASVASDRAECLEVLCDGAKNLEELKSNLKKMFEDTEDKDKIICSSIHKFKGRERDEVFILENTLKYFNQEEKNIVYVAITRSKNKLYFVK